MSQQSDYEQFMREMREWQRTHDQKTGRKKQPTGKRTVKYLAPGHTQVQYESRKLDIYFKPNKAAYMRKTGRTKDVYAGPGGKLTDYRGRDIGDRVLKSHAKGSNIRHAQQIARDKYTLEDMRAMLRDERWDEVCGNKRWNYDSKATVREFKKYMNSRRR